MSAAPAKGLPISHSLQRFLPLTQNSPACLGAGRGSSSDHGTRLLSTPILPSWAAQALQRDSPGKGTWSLSHETESLPHPHDLSHVTTSLCMMSHPLGGHDWH